MKASLTTAAIMVLALTLGACGGGIGGEESEATDGVVRIGLVSTDTGPLAPFGEANAFVVEEMEAYFKREPAHRRRPGRLQRRG